jgi:endogenous inhibitor of DNA gyrase (YacG/DUF329 family)
MADETTLECPACGSTVEVGDAEEKGQEDPHARLTCPTCGAGLDREGNLVHEPAVGP